MQMLTKFLTILLILSFISLVYGECELDQMCGCTNFTNKNEEDTWSDTYGEAYIDPPEFSACSKLKSSTQLEVNEGSGYVKMTSTTKIGTTSTNPQTGAPGISCVPSKTFNFKANAGSGGATWNCRAIDHTYANYPSCYFTVQVNTPPPSAKSQVIGDDLE